MWILWGEQQRKVNRRKNTLDLRIPTLHQIRRTGRQNLWKPNPRREGTQENWFFLERETMLQTQGHTILKQRPAKLKHKVLYDLKCKRNLTKRWKLGHATKNDYIINIRPCKDKTRTNNAQFKTSSKGHKRPLKHSIIILAEEDQGRVDPS